jgi:hypothetical protein
MAKAAGKAKKKNSAFMKPMQPSEQLGENCRCTTASSQRSYEEDLGPHQEAQTPES